MRKSLSGFIGAALLVVPSVVLAQVRVITGTVTVAGSSQPVADATVSIIGTTAVTRTGPEGTFRLTAPAGAVQVAARAIGYKRVVTPVAANQATVNFALERDVLQLEGVIVTGQATTVDRANAAVAVSTVSAEELNRVPAPALESALQGKVVGARINMNSGAPGGGGQVQIRGVTTILGNGQPLYVVDGVIISNDQIQGGLNTITGAGGGISGAQDNGTNRLADLNPADISNIEILKGAAASAIYGSRATNGVVVITTKRGQRGDPRFTLSQRVGTFDAMNLIGTRRYTDRGALLGALTVYLDTARAEVLIDSIAPNGQIPHYNYLEQLYGENQLSYETSGSVSGGTETTRYYASLTTKYDGGIARNTDARRDALHTALDQSFGEKWDVSVTADLTRTKTRRGVSNNNNASFASPLYNFGYTPAIFNLDSRDATGGFPENPVPGGGGTSASNPFETFTHVRNLEDVFRMIGSGRVSYEAMASDVNRLTFTLQGGVDRFNQEGQVYSPNFLQYEGYDGYFGRAVEMTANSRRLNGSLNGVWSYSPRGLPAVFRTSAGVTQEREDQNIYRVQARGLIPGIDKIDQGVRTTDQTRLQIVDQALYAQEEIAAFDDRLNVNLGLRADRSSANGDREKYYLFPKASAAYTFRDPFAYTDRVKLRAAVGQSGNRPGYGVRDVTLLNSVRIDGQEGIGANPTLGNPAVEPERMTEFEYGVDITMLDDRAALEATYFDRTISDLYLQAPLAQTSGLTNQIFNGGEMTSRGIELALNTNPIQNWRGLSWVSRATFFSMEQEISELPVAPFIGGGPGFGAAYGRVRIAKGASSTSIWGNAPFIRLANGDTVMAPANYYLTGGPEGSTFAFRRDTIIGDATPDFEMSFGNDFTFGDFSVTTLLDWRKGGFTSNLTNNLFDEGRTAYDYDEQVTYTDEDGQTVTMPRGQFRYQSWNNGSDARVYVQDGSYVKLREVTVAYTVPQAVFGRVLGGAQSLRLSLSGRNLAIWSDYWGMDPEVSNFGNQNGGRFVDLAPFPPSRSFFFSVDVGF